MIRQLVLLTILFASTVAIAQGISQGEAVYKNRCAVCHGSKGEGRPGLYPPLAGSLGKLLAISESRAYLVWVISYGLSGPITSGGTLYNGVMLAYPDLSLEERTSLLNFLLTLNAEHLPRGFEPFRPGEVAEYLASKKTPSELRRLREEILSKLDERRLPRP